MALFGKWFDTQIDGKAVSLIDGGHLQNDKSLFSLLEEASNTSGHGSALICMHQQSGHLGDLLKSSQKHITTNGDSHKANKDHCLTISYSHLYNAALKVARGFAAHGILPESTMILLINNGVEFAILLWAAVMYRLTIVCLDESMTAPASHSTLREMLKMLKPTVVVITGAAGAVSTDIAVAELQLARPCGIKLESGHLSGWKTFSELVAHPSSASVDVETMLEQARNDDPERVHSILFTSGTSGAPKGCPLRLKGQTHFLHSWSWLINKDNATRALQQAHNSRAIAPTQVLQTWASGGTVVMPGRSFVVEDTLTAIEKHGATFVVLSPPMVHAIAKALKDRPIDTTSVRTIQIGGDAVTKDTLLRCSKLFPQSQVCIVHGMSEGVAAYRWPFFDTPMTKVPFLGESTPVGYVAPGTEVKLWDSVKQRIADRGEPAEMHISSASIIQHYLYGRSESSFYEADGKRWFVTGDIAMMDASGLVYILGRAKDVIWRAGKAIMPAGVESSIQKLTGQQTCVVGVKHASLGQQAYAIVAEGVDSEQDVITHVQAVFGPTCVLSRVLSLKKIGLAQFPVNATFKIIRQDVEQALTASLRITR